MLVGKNSVEVETWWKMILWICRHHWGIACIFKPGSAENLVTRRSHTRIKFISVNDKLITLYHTARSRIHCWTGYICEVVVAARVARNLMVMLWIKLNMSGVPIDGPAYFYWDNNSVDGQELIRIPWPWTTYHIIRETAAELELAKEPRFIPSTNDRRSGLSYYPNELSICERILFVSEYYESLWLQLTGINQIGTPASLCLQGDFISLNEVMSKNSENCST